MRGPEDAAGGAGRSAGPAMVGGGPVTPQQWLARGAKWVVLALFLAVTFLPLLWLVISSFKTNLELLTNAFSLPAAWQLGNYANAIRVAGLPRLFVNSLIVSSLSMALNLAFCSMAGFVLAREWFRGRELVLNLIVAGVLVPVIALMVPYFRLITVTGLYDSLFGLALTYAAINVPVSVFLLHGFMRGVPRELEEAAVIDGCGFAGRYARIMVPLSQVGLVTAGTFVFLFSWNEFIYALLLTSSVAARTLQLGIRFFVSQFFTDYTSMFAAITLAIIPSILVYVLLHERIIRGLTAGAVKG